MQVNAVKEQKKPARPEGEARLNKNHQQSAIFETSFSTE
jgi:hypothetical protein